VETVIVVVAVVGALALVLVPLARGQRGASPPAGDAQLEREITAYRAALRSGTLCRRCGRANARDARFCGDCGRPLAAVRTRDAPAR
jgi:hypothetical protein